MLTRLYSKPPRHIAYRDGIQPALLLHEAEEFPKAEMLLAEFVGRQRMLLALAETPKVLPQRLVLFGMLMAQHAVGLAEQQLLAS